MTVAELALSSLPPHTAEADLLVLGVRIGASGPELAIDGEEYESVRAALGAIGASGKVDELKRIHVPGLARGAIALIGLGRAPGRTELRYAAGSAARQLIGAGTLALALPSESHEDTEAVLEGAAIGAYSYADYRSTPQSTSTPASSITVHGPGGDVEVWRAGILATAVHTIRDLVNTPGRDLYPETFAERVSALTEGLPLETEVLAEPELLEGGFGGILGVGQGSSRGPRLVAVRYEPEGASTHLSLVGKGITFDSGGLSLKPAGSMVGMKYDMTGAATALAAIVAIAKLDLPVRVTAWLCLAENLPSGTAIRPNDVLTIRGGTTVEVLNTDAEGRLVLADGLVAASEESPDAIVDIATLTGAATVALGRRTLPVMGDDALIGRLVEIGRVQGETLWHMPIPGELRQGLDSGVADLANARIGSPEGGMLLAAAFLKEFVGRADVDGESRPIPWAHLDIAGTANNPGGGYGYTGKGPTGVALRTLVALAAEYSGS